MKRPDNVKVESKGENRTPGVLEWIGVLDWLGGLGRGFLAAVAVLAAVGLLGGCDSFKQKPSDTGNIAVDAVHDYGQNIHTSLEAGKKTDCANNLSQLRLAIQIQKQDNEGSRPPAGLADLGTQVRSMETCPSSGQPYQYDASTGRVWCTTPGHEKL